MKKYKTSGTDMDWIAEVIRFKLFLDKVAQDKQDEVGPFAHAILECMSEMADDALNKKYTTEIPKTPEDIISASVKYADTVIMAKVEKKMPQMKAKLDKLRDRVNGKITAHLTKMLLAQYHFETFIEECIDSENF